MHKTSFPYILLVMSVIITGCHPTLATAVSTSTIFPTTLYQPQIALLKVNQYLGQELFPVGDTLANKSQDLFR